MRFADSAVLVTGLGLCAWVLLCIAWMIRWRGRSRISARTLLCTGSVAALLVGFAAVVDAVEDGTGLNRWDRPALGWFADHRSAVLTAAMNALSFLGGTLTMAVCTAVGATVLVVLRRRAEGAIVVLAGLGAAALIVGLKHLYARDRPSMGPGRPGGSTYSLPSGHATGSIVVIGILIVAVVLLSRRSSWRTGALLASALAVPGIGLSRLYLGVHWVTDVVAGWLVGGAWLTVCAAGLVWAHRRRDARSRFTAGPQHTLRWLSADHARISGVGGTAGYPIRTSSTRSTP